MGHGNGFSVGQSRTPPSNFCTLQGLPILIHSTARLRGRAARVPAIYVAVRKPEISRMQALLTEYTNCRGTGESRGGWRQPARLGEPRAAFPVRRPTTTSSWSTMRCGRSSTRPPLCEPSKPSKQYGRGHRWLTGGRYYQAGGTYTAHGAIVTATIPREYVVQAQTPQGFRCEACFARPSRRCRSRRLYRHRRSQHRRALWSVQVAVVLGSPANLKITHPGDLKLAEFYLEHRS